MPEGRAATASTAPPPSRLRQPLPARQARPDRLRAAGLRPSIPSARYPVLYLQDGQNLFDGRTSFIPGRTWQVREHADAAIAAGEVEPLVIVGIYNTGDRRLAEYTHERDRQMGGGEAARLRPDADPRDDAVDRFALPRAHRSRIDRPRRLVAGRAGYLVSGPAPPGEFGKLAVLSPSVWWNHKSILGYVNERAPEIWERPRLWLDVGDREGSRTLRDAEHLARRLIANGWRPGETLHFERVAGGTHDEASWATRVRPMLKFLFPAQMD